MRKFICTILLCLICSPALAFQFASMPEFNYDVCYTVENQEGSVVRGFKVDITQLSSSYFTLNGHVYLQEGEGSDTFPVWGWGIINEDYCTVHMLEQRAVGTVDTTTFVRMDGIKGTVIERTYNANPDMKYMKFTPCN